MQPERRSRVPTARSLLVRRSAARQTVLVATGVTVFLLSLALSSLVALGIRGPVVATRSTLAASATIDSSVILSADPTKDPEAQDAGVRRVIASTFEDVPIQVTTRRVGARGRNPAAITWTITPNSKHIMPSQLGPLARSFARIEARVDASTAARSPGANLSGHGPQTVSEMRVAIAAVDTVLPIPLTVLSLAGIIALLLCARLLTTTRENEARLVRARGGSVRTLVLADSTEILLPAIVGVVSGGLVAQFVLYLTLGMPTSVLEATIAPVGVLAAALIVSAISGAAAGRAANGAPRPSSGRAGTATAVSLAALLVIVSGIAMWRFLQYGTPIVGRPQDVAAILAPALLLCTAAMLSLLLFFPVTGWLQKTRAQDVGMLSVFPARTLHRNPRLFAGPIALLVISVATAVTASGYGATWSGFLADSTRLVTGSDVRATFGGEAVTSGPSSVLDSRSYAKLPGVRDVIPVLRQPGTLSDENLTVIGLSAAHANSIVGPTSSVLDVSGLRRALTPNTDPLPGVELPKGATSLTVRVSASAAGTGSASVLTTLWLADAVGDLSPVELKSEKISTTSQHPSASPVTLSVPATGPWRIVAVDATITTTHQLHDFALGIVPATAHSTSGDTALAVRNPADWKEQYSVFNDGVSVPGPAGAIGFTRATLRGGTNTSVRLMPPGTTAVPVVVSRALAEANELRTGNQVDIDGQWGSFTARVAGVVPLVPGVDSQASLIADLRALDNGWLRSSEQVPALHELWIAGSPDGQVEREAAGIGDARITIASGSVSRSFVGGAVTGLWIGAAGSAAFAIVTLIASLASIVRRRTREVGVLRALGMDAREQSAMRRAEITVVLAFGLVLGLLTGALMLAFTVGTLARSSTPEAPAVLALAVRVDALWPLALVGALVLVSILVIGKYLAVIRRSARGAKP